MDNQNQELDSFDNIKDQVIELLDGDDQEFIYLTGAAGTGKTTLLEVVKSELDKKMIEIIGYIPIKKGHTLIQITKTNKYMFPHKYALSYF